MLIGAARGHHPSVCREAKEALFERGAVDTEEWEEILGTSLGEAVTQDRGAPADQEEVCRLLVEWGAGAAALFATALGYDNARLAWLSLELCANDGTLYEELRAMAYSDFARFILEHPKGSYDELLFFGEAWGLDHNWGKGHSLCKSALAGGARCVEWLLCEGAYTNDKKLCRLAVRYGARDFNGMLMAACAGEHGHLVELAQKWGATAMPRHITDLCQNWDA
jgi:hypothetical protein